MIFSFTNDEDLQAKKVELEAQGEICIESNMWEGVRGRFLRTELPKDRDYFRMPWEKEDNFWKVPEKATA